MADLTQVAEVVSAIVLTLIFVLEAISRWQDRKDRRMDRREAEQNLPHFVLGEVKLDFTDLEIERTNPADGLPGGKIQKVKVGILKACIQNAGRMNAKNAQPFIEFGNEALRRGNTLTPAVWVPMFSMDFPVRIGAPSFLSSAPDMIAEFLRWSFFGNDEFGSSSKKNATPDQVSAVCLFFALEKSTFGSTPTLKPNDFDFPIKTSVKVNVVMDDAPSSSVVITPELIYKSWNEMDAKPL